MDARCCPRRSRKEQLAVCVLPHQDECIDRLNWCGCERQSEWRVRARFWQGGGGARGCGAGAEDRRAGSESARAGPPEECVRRRVRSWLLGGSANGNDEKCGNIVRSTSCFPFRVSAQSPRPRARRSASPSAVRRCSTTTRLVRRGHKYGTARRGERRGAADGPCALMVASESSKPSARSAGFAVRLPEVARVHIAKVAVQPW